jgi:SagB-type dehydrogenase family enzyme
LIVQEEAKVGRRLGFLSTPLDDPRRIQLRQGQFLEAYRRRSQNEDVIEIGHNLTKLQRTNRSDVADAFAVFQQKGMYQIQYNQDREYPLQRRIALPEAIIPDRPFSELIRGRRSRRSFQRRALGLQELSCLLFCALGETDRLTTGFEDDRPVEASLRSIPSGGALHPTRIFAVLLQQGELAPGVYHYDAPEHGLELVSLLFDSEVEALFAAFPIHPAIVNIAEASALFFVTSKFWRVRAKYGPRGYRYCLQEAGAACQNLSLAAVALGLAHVVLGGFYDDEVHACLHIDGVDHAVITAIAVGALSAEGVLDPRHAGL